MIKPISEKIYYSFEMKFSQTIYANHIRNTYPALTSINCNKFSKITLYVLLHYESRHYT